MTNITKPIGERNRLVSKEEAKAMLERVEVVENGKEKVEETVEDKVKEKIVVGFSGYILYKDEAEALKSLAESYGKNVDEFYGDYNSGKCYFNIRGNHVIGLWMTNQGLTEIPEQVNTLTKLDTLVISSNHIKEIKNIDNIQKLKVLDVGNNNLKTLGDISYLTNLDGIFVYKNKLSKKEISALRRNIRCVFE